MYFSKELNLMIMELAMAASTLHIPLVEFIGRLCCSSERKDLKRLLPCVPTLPHSGFLHAIDFICFSLPRLSRRTRLACGSVRQSLPLLALNQSPHNKYLEIIALAVHTAATVGSLETRRNQVTPKNKWLCLRRRIFLRQAPKRRLS